MKKICIIEDDLGISSSLKLYLENSDFEVLQYETGEGANEFILEQNPDLVILDINLPKKDGIQICKDLRAVSTIPVVMLTARDSEVDKITGLEVGADDYIAKPFSPRELLARIQSILRRLELQNNDNWEKEEIEIWNIKINIATNQLFIDEEEVNVTKNEFDILEKIVVANGSLVTRESLMKDVIWYDNYVYDRTIDTHIKNLRRKLGEKDLIVTVRWKGYRLNV